ncbi:hypothetical protein [Bacillus sp. D48C]
MFNTGDVYPRPQMLFNTNQYKFDVPAGKHSDPKSINANPDKCLINFNWKSDSTSSQVYLTKCEYTSPRQWELQFFNPDPKNDIVVYVNPIEYSFIIQ